MVKAFENGQSEIPLHIFPFRLTDEKLNEMTRRNDFALWQQMQPAYQFFEKNRLPPRVIVRNQKYQIAE
jgi:murein L,D-transpeptidase YafK